MYRILVALLLFNSLWAGEGFVGVGYYADIDLSLHKLIKSGGPYYAFMVNSSKVSFSTAGTRFLHDDYRYNEFNIGNEYLLKIKNSREEYENFVYSLNLSHDHWLFGLEMGKYKYHYKLELDNYSWKENIEINDSTASVSDPKHINIDERFSFKSRFHKGKLLYKLPNIETGLELRFGITYTAIRDENNVKFDEDFYLLSSAIYKKNHFSSYAVYESYGYLKSSAAISLPLPDNLFFKKQSAIALQYENVLQETWQFFYFDSLSQDNEVNQQIGLRQSRIYNAVMLNSRSNLVLKAIHDYPFFLNSGWYLGISKITGLDEPVIEIGSAVMGFVNFHASQGGKQITFSIVAPNGMLTFADIHDNITIAGKIFFKF